MNPFVRRDQLNYYPSRDPFADTPITVSQNRFLTNYGVKADLAISDGHHDIKFGTQIQQTRLMRIFSSASPIRPTIRFVWTVREIRCCCRRHQSG